MIRFMLALAFITLAAPPALAGEAAPVPAPESAAPADPLAPVEAAVDRALAEKATPVLVFDLDGTLFTTDRRHALILKEWAEKNRTTHPGAAAKLAAATDADGAAYTVEENLAKLGVTDPAVVQSVKDYWWKRFFTNELVVVDPPVEGGAAFVKRLHAKGAVIVYLTGRDVPQMGRGTQKSLQDAGFPVAVERAHMMLKPDPKTKDVTFKEEAAEKIRGLGRVVGIFENQPRNLVALAKLFPGAVPVFVETNFDPKDELSPPANAIRIKSYGR